MVLFAGTPVLPNLNTDSAKYTDMTVDSLEWLETKLKPTRFSGVVSTSTN